MNRIVAWMLVVFAAALSVVVSRVFSEGYAHEKTPFQAGVKGSTAEVSFDVSKPARHSFYLDLYFKAGDSTDPARVEDRERVSRLAGSGAYDPKTESQIDKGVPIPVRLTVVRLSSNAPEPILDRVYTDHDQEGFTADYYSKVIVRYKLEPGRYRARIEALEDVPVLHTVPIQFDVHVAHDRF